ncbi:MAG: dihydrofolate reductase [Deltaproteobacteria bacterium]|nr:dihydrofolate reductase [Deltaproteobacteria bacterium]
MILCAIAAMTDDRVIGVHNKLPWHIPEDLEHFKKTTLEKTIIMGRKTFESIGRPLPKRRNIVITRQPSFSAKGIEIFPTLEKAISTIERESTPEDEVFIVGGAEIYKWALPHIQRFYMTFIHQKFEGDAYFPEVDFKKDFKIISERDSSQVLPEPCEFSFVTYERK